MLLTKKGLHGSLASPLYCIKSLWIPLVFELFTINRQLQILLCCFYCLVFVSHMGISAQGLKQGYPLVNQHRP
jgi:hypothetical protein